MVVIADTRLIERRLRTDYARGGRRRAQRPAPGPMPDWAADALVAVGMTRAEIAAAEPAPNVPPTHRMHARDEAARVAVEEELLAREAPSPATLHALGELALARLKHCAPLDSGDVRYHPGEAGAVALFEQVVSGLARLRDRDQRRTG
jgi:hypothetical protein